MTSEEQKKTDTTAAETPAGNGAEQAAATAAAAASAGPAQPAISLEELGALLGKLDQATAEATTQKERYLRSVADLENYRKRAIREKEEARRQATCGLLEDLLPVIDNFRLGLQSAEQHAGGKVFADGFRMILVQMESALRQNGLEEINPQDQVFDPNFHESVAHLPHETVADGHIIEVKRIGYKIQERLLRPAAVIVSSGPARPAAGEPPQA